MNFQALIAYALGVLVAYVIQVSVGFGGGNLFTVLIVVAIGGLWYHLRRVL